MFGTIAVDFKALSPEEKARYSAWYCGLCGQLDQSFGSAGYTGLTYDMTFLAILLSSLYGLAGRPGARRCVSRPFAAHPTATTEATAYAADMNLFLAYYQRLDDWNDDKNRAAKLHAEKMQPFIEPVRRRNPRQCAAIEEALADIGQMEKRNELNPDLPANRFGALLAEVFVWREDEYASGLRRMAGALGRFVYLLDAVNDLRADIRKERYNPLVAMLETDYTPALTMMMAECTDAFARLPLSQDEGILQNVLYAGVWQKYRLNKRKGARG